MDTLTNYIVERIRIVNIKHREFPVDGTIDDIIQFLKDNGFEEITVMVIADDIYDRFNTVKMKCFDTNAAGNRIWFADTSKNKISEDNPVFLVFRSGNTNKLYYSSTHLNEPREKSDFLEMVNKRFGF